MSIVNDSLQNKLISALKIDDLWVQFLEAYATELELFWADTQKSKDIFNIYEQLEDGLLDIANTFGYIPNLIIDNSLEMVRKEVQSIPIRIRNKTTYDGYYMIMKQIGRIGDIYNYYWSGNKLIRAIKIGDTIEKLESGISFTEPFVYMYPDKNFSVISSANPINLDSGYNLDDKNGQFNWQLDENIQVSPTKHLGIEYYTKGLVNDETTDYILESDYFRYLASGVEYTRRCSIVPHTGVQIVGITSETGGYNFFDTTLDYSVPKLKLKVCTTFEYTKQFVGLEPFDLDGDLGLDEIISWRLDTTKNTNQRLSINNFRYISCGCGTLNIPSESYTNIFPYDKIVLFYTYGDSDNSHNIQDYSINNLHSTINNDGATKKVQGIIGKTVDFNGNTWLKTNNKLNVISSDLTLGFWINPNNENLLENNTDMTVLDFEFLNITYNYSTAKLTLNFTTLSSREYDLEFNSPSNFILEINNSLQTLSVFKNSELIEIVDISSASYTGEYNISLGANILGNNKFIGIIDSTWILSILLPQDTKDYIYNNKQGILTHLSNKLSHYEIALNHEAYSDDKWYMIQSHVKANDVSNDFAFNVDSDITSYMGNTNFFPIKPEYFSFTYKKQVGFNVENIRILTNNKGEFYNSETNENISGKVDYTTGEYQLFTQTEKYITQEVLSNGGTSYIEGNLYAYTKDITNFRGIKPNSIEIHYTLGAYTYIAKDNGLGVISGTSASGFINYELGYYEITFGEETNGDILGFYTYNFDLGMVNGSSIYFEYKTANSVPITEIGLEDENHRLLAYMTFPPVLFDSINDHISSAFFIRKQ